MYAFLIQRERRHTSSAIDYQGVTRIRLRSEGRHDWLRLAEASGHDDATQPGARRVRLSQRILESRQAGLRPGRVAQTLLEW